MEVYKNTIDFLQTMIQQQKAEKSLYLKAIEKCDSRIEFLEEMVKEYYRVKDLEKKNNIAKSISENTNSLRGMFMEEKDKKRVNIFIEFNNKCGNDTVFRAALVKMPKLKNVISASKPNKLWDSWGEFLADLYNWRLRQGKWEGILDLPKEEPSNGVVELKPKKKKSEETEEDRDAKRVKLFVEYGEKCGDETRYDKASKIVPKLGYYLYDKTSRLWSSWGQFLTDYRNWLGSSGKWAINTEQSEEKGEINDVG